MVTISEGFIQSIEKRALVIARLPASSACPISHKIYVDDSHDRFGSRRKCEKFLNILNSLEPKIQFTVEYENDKKSLDFLDTTIINAGEGKYEFKIHRKAAITNVHLKPISCHDEKIKYGIFKGFVHRAKVICSEKYIKDELEFLISIFIENGYHESILRNIISNHGNSRDRPIKNQNNYVSFPYIPNLSKKLKKSFLKAGFTVGFKSGRNLNSILTCRNKPRLPKNSYPGTYKVPCKCNGNYIGHTEKRVITRGTEHEKAIFSGKWDDSALSEHTKIALKR